MLVSPPNFSPYPFDRLPRLTRREAALESAVARWLGVVEQGDRLAKLVGGAVHIRVASPPIARDPHAARAELRIGGASFALAAGSGAVRALAQRLLGGPTELAAPRPLTPAEHAVFALIVATALEDAAIAGEVWPLPPLDTAQTVAGHRAAADRPCYLAVELGGVAMTVTMTVPRDLELRVPPVRPLPRWVDRAIVDALVVVARCALPAAVVGRLAARDVVTVDRVLELDLGDGVIGVQAAPGAVEATVTTGYVRRDMALPDDAHLELTVALGTTQLTVRQLVELVAGQVVPLGRPLAGPFELRAAGRVIGTGELVDLDGELGVRVISIVE